MQVPCSENHFWPIKAHVRCVRVEPFEMNSLNAWRKYCRKIDHNFGSKEKIQD